MSLVERKWKHTLNFANFYHNSDFSIKQKAEYVIKNFDRLLKNNPSLEEGFDAEDIRDAFDEAKESISAIMDVAMSGDYNHLLRTMMEYVEFDLSETTDYDDTDDEDPERR